MKKRKVFISNKGAHDYSSAERFGELIPVTEGRLNPFDTSSMYHAFAQALRDSSPEDYILVTGIASLNAIGASLFVAMHGKLTLLVYRNRKYEVRELSFREVIERNFNK